MTLFFSRPAAWLKVSGADAYDFLQGQFSQDLKLLENQKAVYGLWLTHKGRIEADSFILKGADGYWVGSPFCPGDALRSRLEGFVVADDVTVEDQTAQWAGVSLIGPGAGAFAANRAGSEALVFPGRRSRAENWEWVFPAAETENVRRVCAGFPEWSAGDAERARIDGLLPAVPRDAGPGDLPQETGLGDAVAYDKGCYLGQEVMARLKTRGRTRRSLRKLVGAGRLPELPAPLWLQAKRVGELRSAWSDAELGRFSGLAVTAADLPPLASLSFTENGPPAAELED
jgi:folate-binding protein YgfZ